MEPTLFPPRIRLFLLAVPFLIPATSRCLQQGIAEPAGILSDLAMGGVFFLMAWSSPAVLRFAVLLFWGFSQITARELHEAVQRLPVWQDIAYLFDPTFIASSTAGFHLSAPFFAALLLISIVPPVLLTVNRASRKSLGLGVVISLLLLVLHHPINSKYTSDPVAARYNPLHWFLNDLASQLIPTGGQPPDLENLPASLTSLDLSGTPLLDRGTASNILIITLEGISGISLPPIRAQMQIPESTHQLQGLSEAAADGMFVADFVTHSHQTIRGLYAIHCGDFSKLSYETPKAFELQLNPDRAAQCLPAQLAENGWETHYLQGAPLQFMNKDRVMPVMGFQEVHGLEWFSERTRTDFIWGTTDGDFFRGTLKYIRDLQAKKKPWFLSLLTVATHQPFAATDAAVQKYGSRKAAAVAALDEAVSSFLRELRREGVLDETLVLITSDESHGAEGTDWFSSWGFALVLAPERGKLPRIKQGTYGLVDIEASVLDYLNLTIPPSIIGRSLFRNYAEGRDMVSYTTGKLRWQKSDHSLIECSRNDTCRESKNTGIIGMRPDSFEPGTEQDRTYLFGLAELLDRKITNAGDRQVLKFAGGEIRALPEHLNNEWTDNLIGAQYLDFPAHSKVEVDISLKALDVQDNGVQLRLVLRQFEKEVTTIPFPAFPLLHNGETATIEFDFTNPEARQAFSFHLVGEGIHSSIQIDTFDVIITKPSE